MRAAVFFSVPVLETRPSAGSALITGRASRRALVALALAAGVAARAQLRIVDTALTEGVPGVAYPGYQLLAAGGAPPYTFAITAGSLPAGLTMSAAGLISGTPGAVGGASVSFRVTDSAAASVGKTLSLPVNPPPAPSQWKLKALVGGPIQGVYLSSNYLADGAAFARGEGREVYRTADAGANWTRVAVTPDRLSRLLTGFALSPAFDNLSAAPAAQMAFGAEECGIYKSADRGLSFTRKTTGLPASCNGGAIALSPNFAADGTIWFAAYGGSFTLSTVYKSTDYGETWSAGGSISKAYSNPVSLIVASPNYALDQTLLLLVPGYQGIYKSVNGGASFTGIPLAFTPSHIAFSPEFASDRVVIVSDYGAHLYRSTDGAASFPLLYSTPDPFGEQMVGLQFVKRTGLPPLLLVKTNRSPYGVLLSDNNGDSFIRLYGFALRTLYRTIHEYDVPLAAARDPATGALALMAGSGQGVEVSLDSGRSFAARENGVSAQEAYVPAGGGAGLAVPAYGFWLLSGNRGAKFLSRANPGGIPGATYIYVSPNYDADGTLFVASTSVMYRSTDRGQTFTTVSGLGYPYALSFSPDFNPATGVAYAELPGGGMLRTTDGGRSFTAVVSASGCVFDSTYYQILPQVSPSYPLDGTVFATVQQTGVTPEMLCRSSDFGATWVVVRSTRTVPVTISSVYDQRSANGTPQKTVLYGDAAGNYYRSTDGGVTGTLVGGLGYCYGSVSFKFSPAFAADGTVIKPCDEYGFYRSSDFGANFSLTPGTAGLLYYYGGLQFDPGFDGRNSANSIAVLTTQGNGIWRSTDGARTFSTVSAEGAIQSVDGAVNQVAAGTGGAVFAATAGQGVFASSNGGGSFQPISSGLPPAANAEAISAHATTPANPVVAVKDQGLWRYNGAGWTNVSGGNGRYLAFTQDGANLYAARRDGVSLRSANGGQSWTSLDATQGDIVNLDYNADGTLYLGGSPAPAKTAIGPALPLAANTAPLWAVSASNGPLFSADQGTTWTRATGSNDYALPAGLPWAVISAMGLDAQTGGRIVVAATAKVGSTPGDIYLTRDGGVTWRKVSVPGSGIEATSRDSTAVLNSITPQGTLDLLVGERGSTDGGVYLSGDGGQHWTQVNQGFDPTNLSISSLVKTSCAGCPVQFYSGTYGSGVYTRTITVTPAPVFPATNFACAGTGCVCGGGSFSGPVAGGTPVTLCGSNFQNGVVVEFDGVPASNCAQSGGTVINCAATPPHVAGFSRVRARNPDTRTGYLPANYQYVGGASRANNLRAVKSGADAWVSWNCLATDCTAASPARIYRAQNPAFSLYLEQYNGGASGSQTGCTAAAGTNSCYNQAGAAGNAQSYFWSVE